MLAALLLFCALQSAAEPLPFERLGKALIGAADARRTHSAAADSSSKEADLLRRIAPMFVRIDLGGAELWWPLQQIDCKGALEPASGPRAAIPLAETVLAVEKSWLENGALAGGDRERAKKAIERLSNWARALHDTESPERPQEVVDEALWLRAAFRGDSLGLHSQSRQSGLVLIVAPTRAEYLSVLGAAGVLEPSYRPWFWHASARRSSAAPLYRSSILVPLACGPNANDGPPCENHALNAAEQRQWVAHMLSHLLSSNLAPAAPQWFSEGLALYDAIRATGADETVCTGFRSVTVDLPGTPRMAPVANDLQLWVTRDLSPYRNGASQRYFTKELALAYDKRGFDILDLQTGKSARRESGPFLGSANKLPDGIDRAPEGVKRGFAEFLRAYSCAFVKFLDDTRGSKGSLLAATMAELEIAVAHEGEDACATLAQAIETVSHKKLGVSEDPKLDLEAAFVEWLARRS
jgi:hypothetical protein